jgi:hypothetical protein
MLTPNLLAVDLSSIRLGVRRCAQRWMRVQ